MFGSCFNESCLLTRSYILSTGVPFRGTPGSQLFKIKRGIQVAVDHQAAEFTDVNTGAHV